MTKAILVGNRKIGPNEPCFIAAEIGLNHNGDMRLAKKTIDAAVASGADAVKFQNYFTEDFLEDETLTYTYKSQGADVTESQFAMFKRYELSKPQILELKEYCDRLGICFFSTPTNSNGINILKELGVSLLKNGSDFLTNLNLIQLMACSGLPCVLSTGMATVAEIDDAVRTFRNAGGEQLILLHCTSSYPTPPSEINLLRIPVLADAFSCPVGFSDHSDGPTAAIASRVLGACFIEKHFTLDKALPGPDHRFSSDPSELRLLVKSVREVELSLGTPMLGPTVSEEAGRASFRLSCVATENLATGTQIQEHQIAFRRPGTGIPPKLCNAILGRVLRRAVTRGQVIDWSDLA